MFIHHLLTIVLSIFIIYFPQMNKFNMNIINSNIYLKILVILFLIFTILENYLVGILLLIIYFSILDVNSKEINEGFLNYYIS